MEEEQFQQEQNFLGSQKVLQTYSQYVDVEGEEKKEPKVPQNSNINFHVQKALQLIKYYKSILILKEQQIQKQESKIKELEYKASQNDNKMKLKNNQLFLDYNLLKKEIEKFQFIVQEQQQQIHSLQQEKEIILRNQDKSNNLQILQEQISKLDLNLERRNQEIIELNEQIYQQKQVIGNLESQLDVEKHKFILLENQYQQRVQQLERQLNNEEQEKFLMRQQQQQLQQQLLQFSEGGNLDQIRYLTDIIQQLQSKINNIPYDQSNIPVQQRNHSPIREQPYVIDDQQTHQQPIQQNNQLNKQQIKQQIYQTKKEIESLEYQYEQLNKNKIKSGIMLKKKQKTYKLLQEKEKFLFELKNQLKNQNFTQH